MNLKQISTVINIYTYAFCIGFILVVYVLKLPELITGNKNLIQYYYYDNFVYSSIMDFVLVGLYLLISFYIITKYGFEKKNILSKAIIVFIVSTLLSTIFYILFKTQPKYDNFFSEWFYTVGYYGVIYDSILLTIIYLIYKYIENIIIK
jgi:hypothetical protein